MNIHNQIYFHVSPQLDWQKNNTYFIGKNYAKRYDDLMSRGFSIPTVGGDQIPINAILEGMGQFLSANTKAPFMPESYHFNSSDTLLEVLPLVRSQLTLIRELIFEEVRKEYFPGKLSRYQGLQVIPAKKESLAFWLPQLKTANAKIYKIELTGKLHRAPYTTLDVNSVPPNYIRYNAYQYWLGNENKEADNDECLFEGLVKVLEVIDANKVASKG